MNSSLYETIWEECKCHHSSFEKWGQINPWELWSFQPTVTPGLVPWFKFTTLDLQTCSNHQNICNHSLTLFPKLSLWIRISKGCRDPTSDGLTLAITALILNNVAQPAFNIQTPKVMAQMMKRRVYMKNIFYTTMYKIITCPHPFRVILTSVFNFAFLNKITDFKSTWKINQICIAKSRLKLQLMDL